VYSGTWSLGILLGPYFEKVCAMKKALQVMQDLFPDHNEVRFSYFMVYDFVFCCTHDAKRGEVWWGIPFAFYNCEDGDSEIVFGASVNFRQTPSLQMKYWTTVKKNLSDDDDFFETMRDNAPTLSHGVSLKDLVDWFEEKR
jgi:hypothetical protein